MAYVSGDTRGHHLNGVPWGHEHNESFDYQVHL